jgi:polyisoprenoid-binding protein YceI
MTWTMDAAHSAVTFTAKHMMVTTVRGTLPIRDLEIEFREDDPDSSWVRVEMDAASIDTGQDMRDTHLRSADFLDAEHHPTITFRSTRIVPRGGNEFDLQGELTIRGVTRPVTLRSEYSGIARNFDGKRRAAFSATTRIDREDFGLTWNVALEQGGWLVSKDIKIEIDLVLLAPAEVDIVDGPAERQPAVTA